MGFEEKKKLFEDETVPSSKTFLKYSNPGILSFIHRKESSENMCERGGKRGMERE